MAAKNIFVCAYFDEDRSVAVLPSKKCRPNVTAPDGDRPNVSTSSSTTATEITSNSKSDKFELGVGQEIEVNWPQNRKARWWKGIILKAAEKKEDLKTLSTSLIEFINSYSGDKLQEDVLKFARTFTGKTSNQQNRVCKSTADLKKKAESETILTATNALLETFCPAPPSAQQTEPREPSPQASTSHCQPLSPTFQSPPSCSQPPSPPCQPPISCNPTQSPSCQPLVSGSQARSPTYLSLSSPCELPSSHSQPPLALPSSFQQASPSVRSSPLTYQSMDPVPFGTSQQSHNTFTSLLNSADGLPLPLQPLHTQVSSAMYAVNGEYHSLNRSKDLEEEVSTLRKENEALRCELQILKASNSQPANFPVPPPEVLGYFKRCVSWTSNCMDSETSSISDSDVSFSDAGHTVFPEMSDEQTGKETPEEAVAANLAPAIGNGKAVLIEGSSVEVDRRELRRCLSRASSKGSGAGIFLLKKLILMTFTVDELADSGGQGIGLASKGKVHLPEDKCTTLKDYVISFCMKHKMPVPDATAINRAFTDQVSYARVKRCRNIVKKK